MTFRPHQRSDKTPEELAAQRARRLQQRIARALLKQDEAGDTAIDSAVQTLRDTMKDPKERRATKDHAAEVLLREGNKAAGNLPQTTINHGVTLDGATLMALVRDGSAIPNSGSLVSSEEQRSLPTPTPHLMDASQGAPGDPLSTEAGVTDGGDAPDASPGRVWSEPAPEPPRAAPVSPEAVRAPGDTTGRCSACHARTDDEPHACPVPEEN